ncbi:hypothetical protein [Sphaerothrix gracilis]|uniref:hypothetical protein n=1 Tax=Sphaerothrix gracilis TaxID=3151835 RepID=UPI0031FC0C00
MTTTLRIQTETTPLIRTVHIYRPGQPPQALENPEQVSGEPELSGFSLLLAKIW